MFLAVGCGLVYTMYEMKNMVIFFKGGMYAIIFLIIFPFRYARPLGRCSKGVYPYCGFFQKPQNTVIQTNIKLLSQNVSGQAFP